MICDLRIRGPPGFVITGGSSTGYDAHLHRIYKMLNSVPQSTLDCNTWNAGRFIAITQVKVKP